MMKLEIIRKAHPEKQHKHPILFVHGAAGGAWYFENYMHFFYEKGYDVIAFSLRGHGHSEGKSNISNYTLDDYADDLRDVIKGLDEKPIIIGHSMGGAILQKVIETDERSLQRAILLASAPPYGIHEDSPLGMFFSDERSFLRMLRNQGMTLSDLMKKTLFGPSFSDETVFDIRRKLVKESKAIRKDLIRPIVSKKAHYEIAIDVIGSKNDLIIGEDDLIKTSSFYGCKPHLLEGYSHFLMLDPNWEKTAVTILNVIISR